MEGIEIRDENIRKVLKSEDNWYIPTSGYYKLEYKNNINEILEAFYYKDITNTLMPEYFGFGSRSGFRYILKSFFIDEYYSKAWNLRGQNATNSKLKRGTLNLLSKNLKLDSEGKSISHKKSAIARYKRGTSNFILFKDKAIKIRNLKYGTNNVCGYWTRNKLNQNIDDIKNYVSDGRIYEHNKQYSQLRKELYNKHCAYSHYGVMKYGYHSKAEEDTCKILSDLSLDYDREVVIPNDYNSTYRIDFYIKDLDIYLEIDGLHKYDWINDKLILKRHHLERERYIENKLHKSLIRILSCDINYYLSHKREFLNKIIENKYQLICIK